MGRSGIDRTGTWGRCLTELSPGLRGLAAPQASGATLVCLPYAGGGAGAYAGWERRFPPELRVLACQYPGRGRRFTEPCPRELAELTDELLAALLSQPVGPVLLFGHSMGALVAFELAYQLAGHREYPVKALYASACLAPPEYVKTERTTHALSDDAFAAHLYRQGGLPLEAMEDPELLELVLPIARADFEMSERYDFGPAARTIDVPVVAIGGDNDKTTPADRLGAWANVTSRTADCVVFRGGHFYLHESADDLLDWLAKDLAARMNEPAS